MKNFNIILVKNLHIIYLNLLQLFHNLTKYYKPIVTPHYDAY